MKKQVEPLEDVGVPKSSLVALEEFVEGSVYRDFLEELDRWDDDLKARLLDDDQQFSGRQYDVFRGGRKFLGYVRDIFPLMVELKKAALTKAKMEARDGK